jgi:mycothiol synthase
VKIVKLNEENYNVFISYCKKHRDVLDDSYLIDWELDRFKISEYENPTFLALVNNDILGVSSLLTNEYLLRGNRARFRILHTMIDDINVYRNLLLETEKTVSHLKELVIFSKYDNSKLNEIYIELGFIIDRYIFILIHNDLTNVRIKDQPENYYIKPMNFQTDCETYRQIRNDGFKDLKGSEIPMSTDEVSNLSERDDYIPDGIFILYHQKNPIGIIRTYKELHNEETVIGIGPIAINYEYRGKGLGQYLLNYALAFGNTLGYKKAILNVNADNENAVNVYKKTGFELGESFISFKKIIKG